MHLERLQMIEVLYRQGVSDFRTASFQQAPVRFGSGKDTDIRLSGLSISRLHAMLEDGPSGLMLRDMGSLTGTQVNQRAVSEYGPLSASDDIRIGTWQLKVRQGVPPALATSVEEPQPDRFAIGLSRLRAQLDAKTREWGSLNDSSIRLEVYALIEQELGEVLQGLTASQAESLADRWVAELVGLGPLESIMRDTDVTEIMVNSSTEIFVERFGRCEKIAASFDSPQSLRGVIERIFLPIGRRIDEASPMADGRLPDGSRVNAVLSPPAIGGPCLTIRRFTSGVYSSQKMVLAGTLSEEMADYLCRAVHQRKNIVVCGGTGSGKTTTLKFLASLIPESERIVTVEDAAELQLTASNLIALEARTANQEGSGEISIRDLVRNALRMRPDRIVVGECRGGEALDMLQAMNTGHEGSLTTVHANTPRDALYRLEVMVLMAGFGLPIPVIREQIQSAIGLIVHQQRCSDGVRRLVRIEEVSGIESGVIQLHPVWEWSGSAFRSTEALWLGDSD